LEVRRISEIFGRIPTKEEVAQNGNYPIDLYNQYFISWGEACAAARTTGMSEMPRESQRKSNKIPQLSLLD
jgi:hypothetical protein